MPCLPSTSISRTRRPALARASARAAATVVLPVLPELRGPGLHVIRPVGDRMAKVNMQIVAMAVPAQEGITRDNVTVRVDAVVYFRVVDPIKATVNVQNYMFAISQQAQTSLRSIIGQSEMDQLLAERDSVNRELRRIIDEPTEGPWGVRVGRG